MPNPFEGENGFTIKDIEAYLNGEGSGATPAPNEEGTPQPTQTEGGENNPQNVTETQAFAHRLKDATEKARAKEREDIAKQLGFESYEALQKSREKKTYEDKGLDPEEVAPVVEEIVKQRLENDPRMQELESYRQKQAEEWAKKELTELKTLTGGKITKLDDVPKDVIELWKTKGSLKGAYLELHGEELIREMQRGIASEQNRTSTGHLQSPRGNTVHKPDENVRPFTEKEKQIYKLFNPEATDEELSKMTKKV